MKYYIRRKREEERHLVGRKLEVKHSIKRERLEELETQFPGRALLINLSIQSGFLKLVE